MLDVDPNFYFFFRAVAANNKIFQFKLVLLGESAVGKSSLVLRFVKGQFLDYQESTIGGTWPTDLIYSFFIFFFFFFLHFYFKFLFHFRFIICGPHLHWNRCGVSHFWFGGIMLLMFWIKFMTNFFRDHKTKSPFFFLSFSKWCYRTAAFLTQTVCLNDTTVKFEIWDTAGQVRNEFLSFAIPLIPDRKRKRKKPKSNMLCEQERYHSLAPMYYRGAQAAIVVYDLTNPVMISPVHWRTPGSSLMLFSLLFLFFTS